MKAVKLKAAFVSMSLICLFSFAMIPDLESAQQENHCFTCHTNPRKLIEITREIAKTNINKPGASKETKGEG